MNRRRFLELLGKATVTTAVAYSFPDIIIPKNIIPIEAMSAGLTENSINIVTLKEIYPELIRDLFFINSPMMARMKSLTEDKAVYEFSQEIRIGRYIR